MNFWYKKVHYWNKYLLFQPQILKILVKLYLIIVALLTLIIFSSTNIIKYKYFNIIYIWIIIFRMTYWFRQLYQHCSIKFNLPQINFIYTKFNTLWIWRLNFLGLCHEELYARIIELLARRLLILPALFFLDKFISTFMNNLIITNTLTVLYYYIIRTNITTPQLIKIFLISISLILLILNLIFYL